MAYETELNITMDCSHQNILVGKVALWIKDRAKDWDIMGAPTYAENAPDIHLVVGDEFDAEKHVRELSTEFPFTEFVVTGYSSDDWDWQAKAYAGKMAIVGALTGFPEIDKNDLT